MERLLPANYTKHAVITVYRDPERDLYVAITTGKVEHISWPHATVDGVLENAARVLAERDEPRVPVRIGDSEAP